MAASSSAAHMSRSGFPCCLPALVSARQHIGWPRHAGSNHAVGSAISWGLRAVIVEVTSVDS